MPQDVVVEDDAQQQPVVHLLNKKQVMKIVGVTWPTIWNWIRQ